jgi:short-subunit dehydrogenase
VARRLARRGDELILLARGREGLEKTARAVRDLGGFAVVEPADVTDREALQAAVDRGAAALGGLDAVIVNAGAAAYGLFTETDPEDVDRTLEVTLNGAINTARAALPHLEETTGTLVVTCSVAGKYALPMLGTYSAAKHGVRGFFNSLRLELRATGSKVRVAQVHPGPVDTPFWVNVTPARAMPPEIPSPAANDPDKVAKALVRALEHPRPERVVGLAMKLTALVPAPIRDAVMVRAVRITLEHPGDDPPGHAIHAPAGDGRVSVLAER